VQGVEWPVANQSKLTLEFIAVEVAEAAIANEQPHTPAMLRTALSGGRLASSGSLPRAASKLGPAAEKAVTEAVTDAAKSSGQPAAAVAPEGVAAARPSILDRLGSPRGPDNAAAPAEAAAADAPAAAAAQKKRQREEQEEEEVVTLDTLFRKTAAKPHLYFLPLKDEAVEAKRARRAAAAAGGGAGGSSGRALGSQPVGPAVMEGL
jgi:hypothetical protein